MNKGKINEFDFVNDFEAMRYWSFPSSYSKEKRHQELNSILYSDNYVASEKKDGYWERIVKDKDGNIFMCSRDKGVNGVVEKYTWVPHLHDYFETLPNGTVLIGEVYLPNKTSKSIVSILGCLQEKAIERQKRDEDKLRFFIFDILAYDNQILFTRGADDRFALVEQLAKECQHDYIDFATYWRSPDEIHSNWLRIIGEGGEGVMMVHKDYPYEMKKKTARKTLKLKKELEESIDVFLTGKYKEATYLYTGKDISSWQYWHNPTTGEKRQGTQSSIQDIERWDAVTRLWFNEMAGAVEIAVMRGDKVQPVGWISGIEDDMRKAIVENPKSLVGKVAELQCMEIDRSGEIPTLRHAKIIGWRSDKDYSNCDWSQVE